MTAFTPPGVKSPGTDDTVPPANQHATGDDAPSATKPARTVDGDDSNSDSAAPECCPRCGQPVATITVRGPTDASYQPCGCRAFPGEEGA